MKHFRAFQTSKEIFVDCFPGLCSDYCEKYEKVMSSMALCELSLAWLLPTALRHRVSTAKSRAPFSESRITCRLTLLVCIFSMCYTADFVADDLIFLDPFLGIRMIHSLVFTAKMKLLAEIPNRKLMLEGT